ncbi:MAG: hypothetical protein ACFE8C_03400 [Promethearchaeota archaeon]
MPEGLIVMKYNDRSGIDIKAKYPKGKMKTSDKTFKHIFNLHEFSKDPGIASLILENINFVTYYSGSKTDYFFILTLKIQRITKKFLEKILQIILKNIEKKNI